MESHLFRGGSSQVANTIVVKKLNDIDVLTRFHKINETFVHEYGHHIGYSVLHKNRDYTDFRKVRGTTFSTNENYLYYSAEWRNLEFEQVAESYAELFFPSYFNKSATPNLTEVEKETLLTLLRNKIN